MPQLTLASPTGQGAPGQRSRDACKWMEEVKEHREEEPVMGSREPQRSNQTPADVQTQNSTWGHLLRTLRPWSGWYRFAPVGVLWSVCRTDVLLNRSFSALDVCGRLLLVCVLWMVVGGCIQALKIRLQPGQNQENHPQKIKDEAVAENRPNRVTLSGDSGHRPPLALVLADSLLLCVLQEPLLDPRVPHIQALLCRLESVSHMLEKADSGSELTPDGLDLDPVLKDRVKVINTYLQQRRRALQRLIQRQRDFEASVKDLLAGLDGLWAQLEELHTGVTLTKEASRGHRDLASAQADAEALMSHLGHYSTTLQSCQANLKDGTQLLQELMWSHTHISSSVSSSGESVWPELLLQSNIEQFDKVQENFLSLEQQTCTFQAHLKGLGPGHQEAHAGAPALNNEAHSCPAPPPASSSLHGSMSAASQENQRPASVDPDLDPGTHLTLCERSALHFSSTLQRLRIAGKRK